MLFSSYIFIFVFLPLVWLGFHILKSLSFAHSYTLAKIFLILSSLFFYAYFKLEYLPILLGSIMINYCFALTILGKTHTLFSVFPLKVKLGGGQHADAHKSQTHTESHINSHSSLRHTQRFYLICGILFNLALLGFFKYTDFLLENFNAFSQILHLDFSMPLPHILLPLALSFVTFQQIAFLIDCYKYAKSLHSQCDSKSTSNTTDSQTNTECQKHNTQSQANTESNIAESRIPKILDSHIDSTNLAKASLESTNIIESQYALDSTSIHSSNTQSTNTNDSKHIHTTQTPLDSKAPRDSKKDLQGDSKREVSNREYSKRGDFRKKDSKRVDSKKDCKTHTDSHNSLAHINFLDYCLFITFFPQLIAGPIVHHKEMMPQFARLSKRNSSLGNQCKGFSKFPEARTPSPLTSENLLKTAYSNTASVALATDPHLQNARICGDSDTESRASSESSIDSIQGFAQSNISAQSAETDSRPCRGVKNALRKCRSAFLAFLTRQGNSEALPLIAEKEKRRFIFFGAKGSGVGINPFFFCENTRFKENRKYSLQLDSKKENLQSEQIQNLDSTMLDCHDLPIGKSRNDNVNSQHSLQTSNTESKEIESHNTDSQTITESTITLDSQTNTQSHTTQSTNTKSPFCDYASVAKGLFIFSIGLFKKVCIADSFAKWANAGFGVVESGGHLNIFESWVTSLSYTFELYFDFSGYCDMAIGLGLLFGIMLPINFNSPYKALNIADFWRRWHITLGRFLKEYVYIPLGGNRNVKHSKRNSSLGNSSLTQSLNDFGGSARSFAFSKLPSPHLEKHSNLTQDTRITEANTQLQASPPKFAKNFRFSDVSEAKRKSNTSNTRICGDSGSDSMAYSESTNPDSKAIAPSHQKPSLYDTLYNKLFTLRNLFIVAFLSGIWHGAGWGFVIWGVLHGLAMCGHRIYMLFYTKLDSSNPYRIFMHTKTYKLLCWLLTFNFVNIAWIFFRAENLQGAINLLKGMFGGALVLPTLLEGRFSVLQHFGIEFDFFSVLSSPKDIGLFCIFFALVSIILLLPNTIAFSKHYKSHKAIFFISALLVLSLFSLYATSYTPLFLYFNF